MKISVHFVLALGSLLCLSVTGEEESHNLTSRRQSKRTYYDLQTVVDKTHYSPKEEVISFRRSGKERTSNKVIGEKVRARRDESNTGEDSVDTSESGEDDSSGIPQAQSPLRVVATSAVIKNRLSKPQDTSRHVKAIHIWGPTPFNTVVKNLLQMNGNGGNVQKRIYLPGGLSPYETFKLLHKQSSKNAFSPVIRVPSIKIRQPTPEIVQINGQEEHFEHAPVIRQLAARELLPKPAFGSHLNIRDLNPNLVMPAIDRGAGDLSSYQGAEPYSQGNALLSNADPINIAEQLAASQGNQHLYHGHHHHHRHHHHHEVTIRAKCEPNPCQNDGVCTAFLHDYECACPEGFMGRHCEDMNQCLPNPCKNNGNCYPTTSGFVCTCVRGFKGTNCEVTSKCIPDPCKNGGMCLEHDPNEDYTCTCRPGYKGNNCEEADFCGLHNHCRNGGTCINGQQAFVCRCPAGYTGRDCGDLDICHSSPCTNGGQCISTGAGTFTCQCPLMYRGFTCDERISPCESFPCHNSGTCVETDHNNYRCECTEKYTGRLCNDIQDTCERHPCLNGGSCVAMGEIYKCTCKPGFSGTTCEVAIHTDECATCHVNAKCIDGKCICQSGYYGNGRLCEALPDISSLLIGGRLAGLNVSAYDLDSSHCHPNPCYNGGTCLPNHQGYTCACPTDYIEPNCKDSRPCLSEPCKHGGTCVEGVIPGLYTCACPEGYKGTNCEEPTACQPNPCNNAGTCIPQESSFICKCAERYQGPTCDVDKCSLCDVHAHCENGKCVCDTGYSGDGTKGDCFRDGASNPRFCLPNPCQNSGFCKELPSKYVCMCPSGFNGKDCEKNLAAPAKPPDPCLSNPCRNGGTCESDNGKFKCICVQGYKGELCQIKAPHYCHPNPCLHGGTCDEKGDGYTCRCIGAYRGEHCDVDDCDQCDMHSICVQGACRCRVGYKGDGFECTKIKECRNCNRYATCVANECVCNPGYTGNGEECHADTCDSCPPDSHCMRGVCVCGKGFYFDGKHCVAVPTKIVHRVHTCPPVCAVDCRPSCPHHCCHPTSSCPPHCTNAHCGPMCPDRCCHHVAQLPHCPATCIDKCTPTCPMHCCNHATPAPHCPATCIDKCTPTCPTHCCNHATPAPHCPATCIDKCTPMCPMHCCNHATPAPHCPATCIVKCTPTCPMHCCNHATLPPHCPATCIDKCTASCPAQCCTVPIKVVIDHKHDPCPHECSTTCLTSCPTRCCPLSYLPKPTSPAASPQCPTSCINSCSPSCPSQCCTYQACPTFCTTIDCQQSCPSYCCKRSVPSKLAQKLAYLPKVTTSNKQLTSRNNQLARVSAVPCPAICATSCHTSCPQHCCASVYSNLRSSAGRPLSFVQNPVTSTGKSVASSVTNKIWNPSRQASSAAATYSRYFPSPVSSGQRSVAAPGLVSSNDQSFTSLSSSSPMANFPTNPRLMQSLAMLSGRTSSSCPANCLSQCFSGCPLHCCGVAKKKGEIEKVHEEKKVKEVIIRI